MRYIFSTLVITTILTIISTGFAQASDTIPTPTNQEMVKENRVIKTGTASYYADKFNGRQTANGEIYRSEKLTAACNVLPLNTWIKVTNLKNKKSVIVKINDRMHPKNKRLVDLSRSAAKKLGFISMGLTKVTVEVLKEFRVK